MVHRITVAFSDGTWRVLFEPACVFNDIVLRDLMPDVYRFALCQWVGREDIVKFWLNGKEVRL